MTSKAAFLWSSTAIDTDDLIEYDEEFYRLFSYHPAHNKIKNKKENLGYSNNDIMNPDREFVIPTDRTSWRGYHKVYSKYLPVYKDKEMDILEIGTEYGYGSLALARYFKNSNITTMELSTGNKNHLPTFGYSKFVEELKRIKCITRVDSKEKHMVNNVLQDKMFDIIIDDGHHYPETQLPTLQNLQSRVKSGGFYVIEDLKVNTKSSNQRSIDLYNYIHNLVHQNIAEYVHIYEHINPVWEYVMQATSPEDMKKRFAENDIIKSDKEINQYWNNLTFDPENYICVIKFK